MSAIAAIWARMPEDDQNRVLGAPELYRHQLIELWDAAMRNERRGSRVAQADSAERETLQDDLDEQLLSRASKGEYGPAARVAVSECMSQLAVGTSRRTLLRTVRRAIEASRSHTSWKPTQAREPEQAPLPLGATGTRDARLP